MKGKTQAVFLIVTLIMLFILTGGMESDKSSEDISNRPNIATKTNYSLNGDPNKYVWGVDLSDYNGLHDDEYDYDSYDDESFFKQMKEKGGKFVLIRFGVTVYNGISNHSIDNYTECARKIAKYCQKYGLYYGYYFVTDAQQDADMKEEIKFIKKFIDSDDSKYHAFPVILDHETYYGDGYDCNYTVRLNYLAKMAKSLKKSGYDVWIYMSESRYIEAQSYSFDASQKFWVASWNNVVKPEKTDYNMLANFANNVEVWQYANDVNLFNDRGIDYLQALDRNLMSEETFMKYVGGF